MGSPAKKKKPEERVQVYNSMDHVIGCYLPAKQTGVGYATRKVSFNPGNNNPLTVDWEECLTNKTFAANTTRQPTLDRVGKVINRVQLVVGKFDDEQGAEEEALRVRVAEAYAEQAKT